METEKVLTWVALIVAGLVALIFLLDLIAGVPFGRGSLVLDILFLIGAAFVIYQGVETWREVR